MEQTTTARVAANVRAEVARRGMSARKLALALDVPASTLSRRLNGTVPFDVDELAAVAAVLAVPLHVLYGEQPTAA